MKTDFTGLFRKQKKAQITIFIILGIVLLAVVSTILYMNRESGEFSSEVVVTERTPTEFKPIKDFVESCLRDKLREAFIIMGQHGGYLDMSDGEVSKKVFKLDPSNPTESDAAFMTMKESSNVAYWWYMKSDNLCKDCLLTDENRPSLERVEEQSEWYINENILSCLDGFKGFERQGFEVDIIGEPSADTTITEENVIVLLTFPINASLEDSVSDMSQFFTEIPLGFREIYDFASLLKNNQADTSFLEYIPKQIIGIYSTGVDSSKLPPIYYREESYVPKVWSMKIVDLNLRSLMTSYVPLLSLGGTNNSHQVMSDDPITQGLFKAFHHETISEEDFSDFIVNFYYFNWPIYLYIGPSDGEMLSATRTTDIPQSWASFTIKTDPPIREYAFFYDISFPIIVEVRRSEELFGDGYSLFFAMEGNIRDNRDIREWMQGNGTYGPNIQDFFTVGNAGEMELPESEEDLEDESSFLDRSTRSSNSLFCRQSQRLSGNMSFKVRNSITEEELEGVKVKFGCGLYEFCSLGLTEFDIDSNSTMMVSKLPLCYGGGILKFEKEGYLDEILIDLSVDLDQSGTFEVEMLPLVKKEVDLIKIYAEREVVFWDPYDNYGQDYVKNLVLGDKIEPPVEGNDSILVSLRKVDLKPLQSMPPQIISFDPDMSSSSVELAPGSYEVRATFIGENGAILEPELRCADEDAYEDYQDDEEEEECYFMSEDPVVMDQIIAGGVEFTNESGYWIVSEDDLRENNTIEFKIIQLPGMVRVEELDEMSLIVNLTKDYRHILEPKFHPN